MKQFLSFLLLLCSYLLCGAQATSLTIDNQNPGWLSSKITYEDQLTVENISITGYINGTDIEFLRSLNCDRKLRGMIDLQNVSIVKGGTMSRYPFTIENDDELPFRCFSDMKSLRKFIYPSNSTVFTGGWCLENTPCDTVIITNTALKELRLSEYVCPTDKAKTKFVYIPNGVESIVDTSGDVFEMGIRFPSSIKSITDYGGMTNARIFAEMLNPETIISEYEVYTGTSSGGWYTKYPAIDKSIIYVPRGLLARYNDSALKNNQIIEYYDLDELSYPDSLDLYVGETDTIDVQALPNSNLVSYYSFFSSNPEIVAIDSNGKVTAIKNGQSSINIQAQMVTPFSTGANGLCEINVYSHVTGISLEKELILGIGESKGLTASLYPIDETDGRVLWESSDANIATVDKNGIVTGHSMGVCRITVASVDGNFSAECNVTIVQPVENILITPKSLTLKVGESSTIYANVYPGDAYDKTITWYSDNDDLAKVNNDGIVAALSPGVVKVYATSNYNSEINDFCEVTVFQPVSGIQLSQSEVKLVEEECAQILATVFPANASNKSVNWASSDVSVAMVSSDGTVYAIKPGQATIMATTVDGGFVALCKVLVKSKTILASDVQLSSNSEIIAIGETVQLNAVVVPEGTTNKTIRWTSTNPNVASVDASGLVTAISEGTTQIVATTTDGSNLSSICKITVKKRFISISQIQISPKEVRIAIGNSLKLKTVVYPVEATNKEVLWSSTDPTIASVAQDGTLTAISAGEASIIASTQDGSSLSATCQVIVYEEAVLVSKIILSKTMVNGNENELITVKASVMPENATNKMLKWVSSDESVAEVADGVIKMLKKGTAIISAEAVDGSNVKADCYVTVSERSEIEAIIEDQNAVVTIFNINGALIYEGCFADVQLSPGVYIVRCKGENFKIVIE